MAYHRAGLVRAGTFVKLYLSSDRGISGSPFGLPPTVTALEAYLELLDGTGSAWAVSAVGDDLVRDAARCRSTRAGGHLHLGLEFYGGEATPTNGELVYAAGRGVGRRRSPRGDLRRGGRHPRAGETRRRGRGGRCR